MISSPLKIQSSLISVLPTEFDNLNCLFFSPTEFISNPRIQFTSISTYDITFRSTGANRSLAFFFLRTETVYFVLMTLGLESIRLYLHGREIYWLFGLKFIDSVCRYNRLTNHRVPARIKKKKIEKEARLLNQHEEDERKNYEIKNWIKKKKKAWEEKKLCRCKCSFSGKAMVSLDLT